MEYELSDETPCPAAYEGGQKERQQAAPSSDRAIDIPEEEAERSPLRQRPQH